MRKIYTILFLIALLLFGYQKSKAQFYSVSTNIPMLVSGSLNAEWSMTINRSWSFHTNVSFNPWKIEKFRIQHLSIRPEFRWWLSESYRGWYLGAHGQGIIYHFGIPKFMRHKYEGVAAGGGLDVGYAFALSPKWNLEFGLGAGVFYADSWVGKCRTCSYRTSSEKKTYVLPDKLALSVVYLF